MGGSISMESTYDRTQHSPSSRDCKYLLGDLDKLTPTAQKIFNLGKGCLDSYEFNSQRKHFQKLDEHFGMTEENSYLQNDNHFQMNELASVEEPIQTNTRPSSTCNQPVLCDGPSEGNALFEAIKQTVPLYFNQTYVKFRSVYNFQKLAAVCAPKKTIIYIQPLDDFPDFILNFEISFGQLRTDLFGLLQGFAQIFFMGFDVCINPKCSTEQLGWTSLIKSRVHSVTGQKQYRASDFYPLLQRLLPSDGFCVVGITWTDLYPEDDMNFVFGEASFQHKSGIFCFGRVDPKTFEESTHSDISKVDGLLIWKLLKVISHELCHVFGLEHCRFFVCLMNESTAMEEALKQPLFLCPVCLRKLQKMCKFDILERYSKLLFFLQELQSQFPSEFCALAICWLEQCISFIQSDNKSK